MQKKRFSFILKNADSRIQIYRWLSTLFAKEVNQEAIDQYRQGVGKTFLEEIATLPACEADLRKLQSLLTQAKPAGDIALELAGAYGFLFHGAGGPQAASPYESVYTSARGSMFQEAEQQTRHILEKFDLGLAEDVREPADHIAIQLELMARLGEMTVAAMQTDTEQVDVLRMQQKTFLENHLLNWIPEFSLHCAMHDPSGFYAVLAKLTVTILKEDHGHLGKGFEDP